jgi:glucans biosynthesis protein
VTVYGLLDSPSVAGAYRFIIDVADTIVMDIDAALYPRKSIERLGIAPGTSMFLDGPNDRRIDNDWRPAIHDSDGLQIYNGNGEWLWRPLVNPPDSARQLVHR